MKKVKLLFTLLFVSIVALITQNRVYASLANQTDLIRINNGIIDFTVTNNTTIEQIKEVFGEPKIVTESAFGGHAYTFYTQSDYSDYLYVETLREDKGIIAYGSVAPGYEVYKEYEGYGEYVSITHNKPLSGYYISGYDTDDNYPKVKGGMYYNWNKWINQNSTDTINMFINTYKSNPQHYLRGISEHATTMFNAICASDGHKSNMTFNEDIFYINEQMKQTEGYSLREYAIKMEKKQYVEFIGTRMNFDMQHTNGYYLLNPAMFAQMYYEYGINRTDYNSDYAVMDYDIDAKLLTAIGIDKDLLTYYDKVPLTSEETSKLERARNLYMTSMQVLGHSTTDIFNITPINSPAANLRAGKLKQTYKSAILAYYNSIRAGQGLTEITISDEAMNTAQHMAVLNSYIVNVRGEQITHSPDKQTMLNDGVKEEFYNTARRWGQTSMAENIAWANNLEPSTDAMRKYINQLIDDSSEVGLNYSHRLSMLHPTNSGFGYGIAHAVGTIEFEHDQNNGNGIDVVTWPSKGVTLLETLDAYSFNWSAQFYNGYLVRDTTQVEVRCLTDGKVWNFDTVDKNTDHFFVKYYQSGAQEMQNRVIFGDKTLIPQPGFVYEITITGLKNASGNVVSYSYRSAFDYGDVSKYGTPVSNISIDGKDNIAVPGQTNTYYVPIGEESDFDVILDSTVKDIKVTWSSQDTSITLTQSGTVIVPDTCPEGKKVQIKVSSDSSGASATAYIVTYQKNNKITFNPSSLEIGLNDGEHKVDIASINGNSSATNIEWKIASELSPDVYYDITDQAISEYIGVRIDENSAYITAKSLPYGNNKFRLIAIAQTSNGIYEGYLPIIVNNPVTHVKIYYNYTKENSIYSNSDLGLSVTNSYDDDGNYYGKTSLSLNKILEKNKNNNLYLKTEIEPKNASVSLDAEWEVISGEDVISKKDENGTFTINKYGQATITAKNLESGVIGRIIINVEEPIESINIKGTKDIIFYHDKEITDQINVTRVPENNFSEINYKSSNPLIGNVDKNGLVTFKGSFGEVTITGTHSLNSNVKNTYTYTVKRAVDSITFGSNYTLLEEGQTYQNTANPRPNVTGASASITYSSSNPEVATVDKTSGKVTGVNVGKATITAKLGEGFSDIENITDSYDVYITRNIKTLSVEAPTTIDITEGPTALTIKAEPQNHTDVLVGTFVSSNDDIATIDENGVVTPKKMGTVQITCTFNSTYEINGKQVKNVSNKIYRKLIRITSSVIRIGNSTLDLNIGESKNINATTYPNNDTLNSNIKYKSDDESIATVDAKGNITAVGVGNTTITAYVDPNTINGATIESTASVFVTNHVTGATLAAPETMTTIDSPKSCSVLYTPSNHGDDVKVTWESSNPSVATIDENGVITPKSSGTTLIRATVIASYTTDRKHTSFSKVLSQSLTVEYREKPQYVKGDINLDGIINADDAADAIEIFKTNAQTEENKAKGDMNDDGKVDAEDAALIIEYFKTHK